jgi:predicted ferric reductase
MYPTTGDLLAVAGYVVLHVVVFCAYYKAYDWEGGADPLKDVGIALGHNTHVAAAVHLLPVTRNSPLWIVLRHAARSLRVEWPASHNYATGWHVLNGLVIMMFVTIHMISFWADWIGKGVVTRNATMLTLDDSTAGGPLGRNSQNQAGHANVGARPGGTPTRVNIWVHESFLSDECWEEYGACLGEIAWLAGALLVVLSLGCVRRSCYYLFLYTHWAFFLVFFIFGGLHDVQLIYWMIPSFLLYGVDWLMRGYRIREVRLLPYHDARGAIVPERFTIKQPRRQQGRKMNDAKKRNLFPEDVGGLFVYLNVPSVSRREWHPFSLCAASPSNKGNRADVIIRPHGPSSWTARVLSAGGDHSLKAFSSGTYGTSDLHLTASTVVFIAGGVGITALEPLLKRVMSMGESASIGGASPALREVVLIWAVRKEEDLAWFAPDIESYREASGGETDVLFESRLFVTSSLSPGTEAESRGGAAPAIGLAVKSVELAEASNSVTLPVSKAGAGEGEAKAEGLQSTPVAKMQAAHGRPDLATELGKVCSRCSLAETRVDVFVCGPSSMRVSVLEAAAAQPGPVILVHDETFEL